MVGSVGLLAGAQIVSNLLSATWSPAVRCVVDCEGSTRLNTELLEILRDQLARCGPQNLTVGTCAQCPACVCEHSGLGVPFFLLLLLASVVSAAGGALASRSRGARPALAPAPAEALPAQPALLSGDSSLSAGAITPSARRAR